MKEFLATVIQYCESKSDTSEETVDSTVTSLSMKTLSPISSSDGSDRRKHP